MTDQPPDEDDPLLDLPDLPDDDQAGRPSDLIPPPPPVDFDGFPPPLPPPLPSAEESASVPTALPPSRNKILILGRRKAGKTIYLARLYEALWAGCTLADGVLVKEGEELKPGQKLSRLSCRAMTGASDSVFMRVVQELRNGRWPAATVGSTPAEVEVIHNGTVHTVTTIDYPGEVFRKAFVLDSEEEDAQLLRDAVDRAKAAILLIDPSVVAEGGEDAREDTFGMMRAALHLRRGHEGEGVPIAVVFTKCDQHLPLLKAAGGVNRFARRHFGQLFDGVKRTRVYPCAAVRIQVNSLGKQVPVVRKAPVNVVEPLLYCMEQLEATEFRNEQERERKRLQDEFDERTDREDRERRKSSFLLILFWISAIVLMVAAAVITLKVLGTSGG